MEDHKVVEAMIRYGGSFVHHLARLFERADGENRARIKTAWPEYWAEYTGIAADIEAREKEARSK